MSVNKESLPEGGFSAGAPQQPVEAHQVQMVMQPQVMMQPQMMIQQQSVQMMMPMQQMVISNDCSEICSCFEDCESCLLGWFCPCVAYGQSRERAGLGPCLPAALMFIIPSVVMNCAIYLFDPFRYGGSYWYMLQECHYDPTLVFGAQLSDHCRGAMDLYHVCWIVTQSIRLVLMVYFMFLLGKNRTKLQQVLGQNVTSNTSCNYFLGFCTPCCTACMLTQEHRVIKRKWIANNSQVLSTPIMPVGTESLEMPVLPGSPMYERGLPVSDN